MITHTSAASSSRHTSRIWGAFSPVMLTFFCGCQNSDPECGICSFGQTRFRNHPSTCRSGGYGIPIELFGPFAETCVDVMQPLIQEFPNDNVSGPNRRRDPSWEDDVTRHAQRSIWHCVAPIGDRQPFSPMLWSACVSPGLLVSVNCKFVVKGGHLWL